MSVRVVYLIVLERSSLSITVSLVAFSVIEGVLSDVVSRKICFRWIICCLIYELRGFFFGKFSRYVLVRFIIIRIFFRRGVKKTLLNREPLGTFNKQLPCSDDFLLSTWSKNSEIRNSYFVFLFCFCSFSTLCWRQYRLMGNIYRCFHTHI